MQPNFPKLLLCGSSRHSQIKYRTRSRLFLNAEFTKRKSTGGEPTLNEEFSFWAGLWIPVWRKLSSQQWLLGLPIKVPWNGCNQFNLINCQHKKMLASCNQGLVHQKIFNGKSLKPIKTDFIDKHIQCNIWWSSK